MLFQGASALCGALGSEGKDSLIALLLHLAPVNLTPCQTSSTRWRFGCAARTGRFFCSRYAKIRAVCYWDTAVQNSPAPGVPYYRTFRTQTAQAVITVDVAEMQCSRCTPTARPQRKTASTSSLARCRRHHLVQTSLVMLLVLSSFITCGSGFCTLCPVGEADRSGAAGSG